MTDRLTLTPKTIRALALSARPGVIALAERAVDERAALDTLSRDLMRIGRAEADLAPFLAQVQGHIGLRQRPLAA